MEEGQIESWFDICRQCSQNAIRLQACRSRRIEEQATMRIKCRGLSRVYCDFAGAILVRHVDGPGTVFALQPGIPSKQPLPSFSLFSLSIIQLEASIAAGHNGKGQSECRYETSGPRVVLEAQSLATCSYASVIVVEKGVDAVDGREAKGGLSGHDESCGKQSIEAAD